MVYKVGQKKAVQPYNLVVFGGNGDLAFRKIYPALYNRFVNEKLKEDFTIYSIDRTPIELEVFFDKLKQSLLKHTLDTFEDSSYKLFFKNFQVICAPDNSASSYTELKQALENNLQRQNIYYYSTPSSAFGEISQILKELELNNKSSKVVVEKPLGVDLKSSNKINQSILKAFKESQIYRIDHYLGKETVQNLMVLRFANNLFERAWNSDSIDNIQITVAEELGVESRVEYYDKSGALRDMVQNHLLQLLCLVAMEPPHNLDAEPIRDEKLKALRALRLHDKNSVRTDTIKGQYTRGVVNNVKVKSYLENLKKYDSDTETFVAIKAYVDNWRWKDVPFYLRTGKRMAKRYSDIVINFKPVKHNIFPTTGRDILNNQLIIRLQPEERIELLQMTKIPGPGGYRYKPIALKLDFMDSFDERFPEAYERLISDIIRGNQTLFMSYNELHASWVWTESILNSWAANKMKNELYEAGSWGPGAKIMPENLQWSNDTLEL